MFREGSVKNKHESFYDATNSLWLIKQTLHEEFNRGNLIQGIRDTSIEDLRQN